MLKKYLLITVIIVFNSILISMEIQIANDPFFQELIINRSNRLETMFYDVDVTLNQKTNVIEVIKNKKVIREFSLKQEVKVTAENLISFFLNVEESLLIAETIKTQSPDIKKQIEVIDALYEYPYLDETGSFFVYISDKGTGNRNSFILDLLNYQEKEIIIPETGDYFPVLNKQILYFLKAVEDGFSLNAYHLITNEMIELSRGKINCLRIHAGKIYYSEGNSIIKIDSNGRVLENYLFENRIQSFDIYDNNLTLSMLNKNQYDLYLFNIPENSLNQLTNSIFNEMDVIFKNNESVLFSANQTGQYALYLKQITNNNTKNDYDLIYQEKHSDVFYPFYSEYYSKVICSVYEVGKEPKFLILSH
ncbi:MAG: hypothetical protein PWQ84_582 [Thermotogaceae bacterium]|nr:hypothetical protein [Thermotogaceae bacterium]